MISALLMLRRLATAMRVALCDEPCAGSEQAASEL